MLKKKTNTNMKLYLVKQCGDAKIRTRGHPTEVSKEMYCVRQM